MSYFLHIRAVAGLVFAKQAAWSPEWIMISTIMGAVLLDLARAIMKALP